MYNYSKQLPLLQLRDRKRSQEYYSWETGAGACAADAVFFEGDVATLVLCVLEKLSPGLSYGYWSEEALGWAAQELQADRKQIGGGSSYFMSQSCTIAAPFLHSQTGVCSAEVSAPLDAIEGWFWSQSR